MKLHVVQYNVFLRPSTLFSDGQRERAERIPLALQTLPQPIDVVVFCEVFDRDAREHLTVEMQRAGFRFHTEVVGHEYNPPSFWKRICSCFPRFRNGRLIAINGGVMVFSHAPFLHVAYHTFSNQDISGTDALAAKGFIHCQFSKEGGRKIHLFATHLQAWNTLVAQVNRSLELKEIHREMLHVPRDEPCILVGDLNVDQLGYPQITEELLKSNHLVSAQRTARSLPATFDSRTDDLVGRDGTTLPSRQWLDYGAFSEDHWPPKLCTMECVGVRSTDYVLYNNECCASPQLTQQLSDHYPVRCYFEF